MEPYSVTLRGEVLAACDANEGTRVARTPKPTPRTRSGNCEAAVEFSKVSQTPMHRPEKPNTMPNLVSESPGMRRAAMPLLVRFRGACSADFCTFQQA
jgi:hypothetical protein